MAGKETLLTETLYGIELTLHTSDKVFSPSGIDAGTKAMLSFVQLSSEDKVLDLGCGCGVVGIFAAKQIGVERVLLCDISPEAVELSRKNAEENGVAGVRVIQSDGWEKIEDRDFTCILCNPPYHTDFSVAKSFIEGAYQRLLTGGRMLMVTKRLDWYKNKLTSVFGGVTVKEKDGYYIFLAEKRSAERKKKEKPKRTMSKKLQRKYGKMER